MKCGFCGHEFEEDEGKTGCGGCPGGCHNIHCPRCNYSNPLEPGLIKSIKKLFVKNANTNLDALAICHSRSDFERESGL